MSSPVKGRRSYESPKRAAQAAATRAEIADAAHMLFVEHGYAGTTLADIAAAAGVSMPTVKLVYGTKRAVLVAAWDRAIKGGGDARPVADQPWFQQLVNSPDPRDQLKLQAAVSREVKCRIAPLLEVIRAAAPTDTEIGALWATMQAEFYDNQRNTIRSLRRKGQLRNGLGEREATDLLWTLNHPTVFQLLAERGWSPQQYERWLANILTEQLLGSSKGPCEVLPNTRPRKL